MLKNILSLLLSKFYSKQESELVGHQAMPSASNTVITPSIKTECTTWSDAHIGIAPADGYLYVTGRTTNTDGFLQISSDTTEIAATTFGNTDKDIRLLFPLAKGQAMKVTAKSLKNIFLRFSSSIGGGYQALKNALLQGGGLCLNSLSSSLRRSSCGVRKNGLLNNGTCRLRMWLLFLFQTTMTFILMFLQRTVCWCLGNLVRQELVTWKSTPLVRDLISISQALEFTKVLQCRLIEAKRFLSRQQQITEEIIRSFTSSRLSVKREVGLGGASC